MLRRPVDVSDPHSEGSDASTGSFDVEHSSDFYP